MKKQKYTAPHTERLQMATDQTLMAASGSKLYFATDDDYLDTGYWADWTDDNGIFSPD